jgi:creatinine amidohydrolase
MGTDLAIAEAMCAAACEHDEGLVVAPSIPYGVSYQHDGLPGGAVSFPAALLSEVVVTVAEGLLRAGPQRAVMLVNGHAGNNSALFSAVDEIGRRRGQARVAACSWWHLVMDVIEGSGRLDAGGIGHAGAIETSVMLAARPDLVRRERIPEGSSGWPEGVLRDSRLYRWLDFDPYIEDGVLGSPRDADEHFGTQLLDAVGERLAALAAELRSKE